MTRSRRGSAARIRAIRAAREWERNERERIEILAGRRVLLYNGRGELDHVEDETTPLYIPEYQAPTGFPKREVAREYFWERSRRLRSVAEDAEVRQQRYRRIKAMVEYSVPEVGLRSWLHARASLPPLSVEEAVRQADCVPYMGLVSSLAHAVATWVRGLVHRSAGAATNSQQAEVVSAPPSDTIPSDFMRTDLVSVDPRSRLPEYWEVEAMRQGVGASLYTTFEQHQHLEECLPVPGVQRLNAIPWVGRRVLQLIANRHDLTSLTVRVMLDYNARIVRTLFFGDPVLTQAINDVYASEQVTVPFDSESTMAESVNTQTHQGESDVTHEQHQGSEDPIGSGPARRRIRIKR